MTDERFWSIADEFEDVDANDQSYVPKKNIKPLVEAIIEANNGDIDETRADLTLFNFKQPKAAQKICNEVIKAKCNA